METAVVVPLPVEKADVVEMHRTFAHQIAEGRLAEIKNIIASGESAKEAALLMLWNIRAVIERK